VRETEIQPRAFDGGLIGLHLRFAGEIRLHSVVEGFLAQRLFLGQRRVTLYVQLGLGELRLVLREFRLGLIQRGLERARINLKQQIALRDLAALRVVLRQQVAGDLRADLRVHVSIQRADPLLEDRHIPRGKRDDLHLRRPRRRRLLLAAPREDRQQDYTRRTPARL